MFRREFLELASVSGVSFLSKIEERKKVGESVELLVRLPETSSEFMVRVLDDGFETMGYWRGSAEDNPRVVSGGGVNVRSTHGFLMTEPVLTGASDSFMWIEGMSKLVVDFEAGAVHLVYGGTGEERYWSDRKKSEFHSHRMKELMEKAKVRGNGRGQEFIDKARRHRRLMYESSKKAVNAIES